eukprot:18716_1
MSPFLLCILILFQKSNSITCNGNCQCNSVSQSTGSTCTLTCNTDSACQDSTLTCRKGDPCIIKCIGKHGCEGAIIIGSSATHVTVKCSVEHGCKSGEIRCGTGDCLVECNSSDNDICKSTTVTNNNNARSFQCIGNQCNEFSSVPNEFSPSPTPSPTPAPTKNPTQNPTHYPTFAPSKNPSPAPTNQPSENPSNIPTKTPTQSPTNPSKNPTQIPTINPTLSPTYNPSRSPTTPNPTQSPTPTPTNNPSNNPSLSPTTSLPSNSPTRSPLAIGKTRTPSKSPTLKPPTKSPTPITPSPIIIMHDESTTLYIVTDNEFESNEIENSKNNLNGNIENNIWNDAINYMLISMLVIILCLCIFLICYLRKKRRLTKAAKFDDDILRVPMDYKHNMQQHIIINGINETYSNDANDIILIKANGNVTTPRHIDVLNYKGNKINISIKPHIDDDSSDSSQDGLPQTTNKISTNGNIVNDISSDTESSDASIINGMNTTTNTSNISNKNPPPAKVIYSNSYIRKIASYVQFDEQIIGDDDTHGFVDYDCDHSISLAQGNVDMIIEGDALASNIKVKNSLTEEGNYDINNNVNIVYIDDDEGIDNNDDDLLNDIVGHNNGQFYVTSQ